VAITSTGASFSGAKCERDRRDERPTRIRVEALASKAETPQPATYVRDRTVETVEAIRSFASSQGPSRSGARQDSTAQSPFVIATAGPSFGSGMASSEVACAYTLRKVHGLLGRVSWICRSRFSCSEKAASHSAR